LFASYAEQFTAEGDTRLSAANKSKKPLAPGFVVDDRMMNDFKASLQQQKIKIDDDALEKDDAFIRAMIHYDIDLALFGVEEARRNLISKDPQAQFALRQFGEAEQLTQLARTRVAHGGKGR
jgi:hypothetical protein